MSNRILDDARAFAARERHHGKERVWEKTYVEVTRTILDGWYRDRTVEEKAHALKVLARLDHLEDRVLHRRLLDGGALLAGIGFYRSLSVGRANQIPVSKLRKYKQIMKLWVDDERPTPDDSWTLARTSDEAILHLTMRDWDEVSLDHDLGGDDTGFIVLDWMIEDGTWPKSLTIHTSNPPARKRMLAAANAEAPADTEIFVIYDHLKEEN